MGDQHALLMLDLVDSTRLSEQLGDRDASVLWASHDQMARNLLVEWRGREIDKSDGFLLVFAAAADAVGYALAYHAALPALHGELAARVGIHVGELIARDNAPEHIARGAKPVEMEGIAKAATARVMAIAQGGQTLLTAAARAALGAAASRQAHSHGHWRMKGLAEPVEIFEVGGIGAAFTPPPDSTKSYRVVQRGDFWLPLREVRHSLPAERDSFVGRKDSLQELTRRFEAGARLVSILGAGGSGKTRLAKRYGWTWLGDFPGGVWFCDLAPATTVDGIAYAVGQGLDVPLSGADPLGQLAHAIAGRGACLVILDNYEQVARHAEATLGRWLDRAADARFIVTSREALGIVGEEAMVLDPLPWGEGASLFLQRATAARSSYEPTADDRAVIEPLVKLLDGLPLAIELAAARVRVMSPRMLLERMRERFKLLVSSGGRPDRQATLRATLDWSWGLLPGPEKLALAQLSVFEGGFALESAEAVVDLHPCGAQEEWVANVIQSLVGKSLIRNTRERRFDMLSTVQAYAAGRLVELEERANRTGETARRHWGWFAALNERQASADRCAESENLVAACRRATTAGDGHAATSALLGAWAVLRLRGPIPLAAELASGVQAIHAGLHPQDSAAVMWIAGLALHAIGQSASARVKFEAGLEIAAQHDDKLLQARLLGGLAQHHFTVGRLNLANELLHQAQPLADSLGEATLRCQILNDLGTCASVAGDRDKAAVLYEKALKIAVTNGDKQWEGGLLGNLGNIHFEQGSLAEAENHHAAALELSKDVGDRRWEGNAHCNLGMAYYAQKRLVEARHQFDAAQLIAREIGHVRLEAIATCNLGMVDELSGELDSAKENYERSIKISNRMGDARSEAQTNIYLGSLHASRSDYELAAACFSRAEAILDELLDEEMLVFALSRRFLMELRLGVPDAAERAFASIDKHLRNIRVLPGSELHASLVELVGLVPTLRHML